MNRLLRGFIVLMIPFSLHAKVSPAWQEFGIFLGCSYYIGDLNTIGHFNSLTKPAAGVVYRYNRDPRLSFRGNLLYGKIEGDDAVSKSYMQRQRNLSFISNVIELSAQAEFNFYKFKLSNDNTDYFTPFLFLGIAGFHFNPQAKVGNRTYDLRDLSTEGQKTSEFPTRKRYRLTQLAIPLGVGIKLSLAESLGLSIEWGMRKTFTDYLDDVSRTYPNPFILQTERGAAAASLSDRSEMAGTNSGRQRGNSKNKDWYNFTGITLTFKLKQPDQPCPSYQ